MPNLSIKNVPEEVLERLRDRASRNHRSLQGELMAIICSAANGSYEHQSMADDATDGDSDKLTFNELMALRDEHPLPKDRGPRAVDILRAERDAR